MSDQYAPGIEVSTLRPIAQCSMSAQQALAHVHHSGEHRQKHELPSAVHDNGGNVA